MLIKFGIEPEALVPPGGGTSRETQALHKRFIRSWEQFGLLVDPGKGPQSISSRLDDVSLGPVGRIWRDAWKARKRCRRSLPPGGQAIDWDGVNAKDDLAGYASIVRVAFVETDRGIVNLGISDNGTTYKVDCDQVEAVLFPYAEESNDFAEMLGRLDTKVIPGGTGIEEIWGQWFLPFAQVADKISFLDRYLFANRNTAGFHQILDWLSSDAPDCNIDVLASNPDTIPGASLSRSEFVERTVNRLNALNNGVGTLTIFLVRDDAMTRERYVSFDECTFHVGHGLPEIFGEPILADDHPCTLDATSTGFNRIVHDEIRRITGHYNVVLTFRRGSAGTWEMVPA